MKPLGCTLTLTCALAVAGSAMAADDALDLMSLEDLVRTEVTTVARKPQSLADVPAAAFVLSADDIRRSGAQNLPDVLRLVPGVEVAQLDNGRYAVSARGFNSRIASKLQVLVDGRSVYNPFFSGTIWEQEFIALPDIERIEVIRGPGAAMWGVNAVNGVINIISKHSRAVQGNAVELGLGNQGQRSLFARHGHQLDDDTGLAFSVSRREADPGSTPAGGGAAQDDLTNTLVNLRYDRDERNQDLSLWATVSRSRMGDAWGLYPQLFTAPSASPPNWNLLEVPLRQGFDSDSLSGRYRWLDEHAVERTLQLSYNHATVDMNTAALGQIVHIDMKIFDLDYQGRYALGNHDLVWGLTHRIYQDDVQAIKPFIDTLDPTAHQRITGVFLQDDWTLLPDVLHLGLGARMDHSNQAGSALSPSATLLWTPTRTDTLWAKFAGSPRLPSRAEQGASLVSYATPTGNPMAGPMFSRIVPSGNLKAEKMQGIEFGARKQFSSSLNSDVSFYRYRYKDLWAFSGVPAPYLNTDYTYPFLAIDMVGCNCMSGNVTGAELSTDWLPLPNLRLQLSYSWIKMDMDASSSPFIEANRLSIEQGEPKQYGSLRLQWNPSPAQKLDATLRGSGGYLRAHAPTPGGQKVPGYITLDLRYAYQLTPSTELAVAGRNLIGGKRVEFISDFLPGQTVTIEPKLLTTLSVKF